MPEKPAGGSYEFGPFRYDAAQRLLFREGRLLSLEPKAIDTLDALLQRRGQVVGKSELMRSVWPDCVVEEGGLARNVSLLRKALGDDAGTYIETIPKRGYRFVAEVRVLPDRPQGKDQVTRLPGRNRLYWATLAVLAGLSVLAGLVYWQFYRPSRYAPRGERLASLAVIPFECLAPELEPVAFAEGLNQVLVAEISRPNSVYVISPGTVRRYRRLAIPMPVMARLLGLDVLVEGSIQKIGDQLRIAVRLSDVHSGRLIWAESYDQPFAGLASAQSDVARAAAAQISARLTAKN